MTKSGTIKQIYEVTTPTATICKQRFLLRTNESEILFMTLFNNISLLDGYGIGDIVTVEYNPKAREVADKVYTDNFVKEIARKKPEPIVELEKFEKGNHTLEEYYNGIAHWISAHHKSDITASGAKTLAAKFIADQHMPISIFHSYLKIAVENTPTATVITTKYLFNSIVELINMKLDF